MIFTKKFGSTRFWVFYIRNSLNMHASAIHRSDYAWFLNYLEKYIPASSAELGEYNGYYEKPI